jgi:hypothetical protein
VGRLTPVFPAISTWEMAQSNTSCFRVMGWNSMLYGADITFLTSFLLFKEPAGWR